MFMLIYLLYVSGLNECCYNGSTLREKFSECRF
jgi:hypothetical protein